MSFEQYGELPERLKIEHEEVILERNIKYYIKKDPEDRYAFLKGLFAANKNNFTKFFAVRLLM